MSAMQLRMHTRSPVPRQRMRLPGSKSFSSKAACSRAKGREKGREGEREGGRESARKRERGRERGRARGSGQGVAGREDCLSARRVLARCDARYLPTRWLCD
eukprot:798733-Rhodomonas_salina.1